MNAVMDPGRSIAAFTHISKESHRDLKVLRHCAPQKTSKQTIALICYTEMKALILFQGPSFSKVGGSFNSKMLNSSL